MHSPRVALFIGVLAASFFACGGDDGPAGSPAAVASSSSGSGASGSSGGTGGGDGGAGASGGTGTGTGAGGTGEGGMGGQGMIGVGGGQGACSTCGDYVDACVQSGCPPKNTLCADSFQIYSAVIGCVCNSCFSQCELTCSGGGSDMPGCGSCITEASTGSCQAPWATCQAD